MLPNPPALALLAAAALLAPLAARAEGELKAMTFNVRYGTANDGDDRWENRKDLVLATIRDEAPDVLGVQEALKFQIDAIVEALPQYKVVGVGRDDGKEAGEYSAVLYRDDRFELVDSGTFWLSDTPESIASKTWGNRIPRICSWARLREREGGKLLDVYNTHFDHMSGPSRLRSAVLIASRLKARSEPVPFVLMGDFNAGEDSPPMSFLRGESAGPDGEKADLAMVDTFRVVHADAREVGTFHGFKGRPGRDKIDAILIAPGSFEVIAAEILRREEGGRYPSDHFPVTATLRRP